MIALLFLPSENAITQSVKVEPHFLTYLCMLPAILSALLPSRLAAVKTEFVDPLIDILSRLFTISLGADGQCAPSSELAIYAGRCAGVLVNLLTTPSLNFDNLDVFHSLAHRPCNESAFLRDPLWRPYVNMNEMLGKSFWNSPTEETFAVAERVVRALYLPALFKLSDTTEELRTYANEEQEAEGIEYKSPQLALSSRQTSTLLQRAFLISVTKWIEYMLMAMAGALKPRPIDKPDEEYLKKVCTQLELSREDILNAPLSAPAAADARLRIPLFDVTVEAEGVGLREKTFRVGLEFLDVLGKLSAKYDCLRGDSSG